MKNKMSMRCLFAALLLAMVLPRCATTAPVEQHNGVVWLEVSNHSDQTIRVMLGSLYLGDVKAGQRARYTNLPTGKVQLRYRFLRNPRLHYRTLELNRGRIARVVVARRGKTEHIPSNEFARLRIINDSGAPGTLTIDGKIFAKLYKGQRHTVGKLRRGQVTVRLTSRGGTTLFERTLVLGARLTRLRIAPAFGSVEVVNRAHESLRVSLDGKLIGVVRDGQSHTFSRVQAGRRLFLLTGVQSGMTRRFNTDLAPQMHLRWPIMATKSALWVQNNSAHRAQIRLNGTLLGELGPGGQQLYSGLAPGFARLDLKYGTTRRQRTIKLKTDDVHRLVLTSGVVHLMIVNRTAHLAHIVSRRRRHFSLKPSESRLLRVPSTQRLRLQAHFPGPLVRLIYRLMTDSDVRSWNLKLPQAVLVVRNELAEVAEVRVHGKHYGEILPGKILIMKVPAGRLVLQATEEGSGQVYRKQLKVGVNQQIKWTLKSAVGGIRVENYSGETVKLWINGRSYGTIGFRKSLIVNRMLRGVVKLRAIGQDSGVVRDTVRWVLASKRVRWRLEPRFGWLIIKNRLLVAVDISIGGRHRARLQSRARQRFKVELGSHRVVARRVTTGETLKTVAPVKSAIESTWVLHETKATLRVVNHTLETLHLRLNGRSLGQLAANATGKFQHISRRRIHVTAFGAQSRTRYQVRKTIALGTESVWDIYSAKGTVVIHNTRDEPVDVRVDWRRRRVATIPARTTKRVVLRVGARALAILGSRSKRRRLQRVLILDQNVQHLVVTSFDRTVEIYNKSRRSIAIRIGDSRVGTLGSGTLRRFSVGQTGGILLEIVDGRHRVSHRLVPTGQRLVYRGPVPLIKRQ